MIPLLGLLAGIVLGIALEPSIPQVLQPYLPIAIVAAMDALFGAFRRTWRHVHRSGFRCVVHLQCLDRCAIVYVGDQIGVGSQLATGVVVVLGIRIPPTLQPSGGPCSMPDEARLAGQAPGRLCGTGGSQPFTNRNIPPCWLATPQPTTDRRRGASDSCDLG